MKFNFSKYSTDEWIDNNDYEVTVAYKKLDILRATLLQAIEKRAAMYEWITQREPEVIWVRDDLCQEWRKILYDMRDFNDNLNEYDINKFNVK